MRPIDPIVIKERRQKLGERVRRAQQAEYAGAALDWFGQYGVDRTKGVVPAPVNPDHLDAANHLSTASACAGHKEAQAYIHKAAVEFRAQIMERAIDMAQTDFDAADKDD